MKRYPSLTWEYGPKSRQILTAMDPEALEDKRLEDVDLQALMAEPIDYNELEEIRLSLLPNDPPGGDSRGDDDNEA
jgi:hypothetical protein